MSKSHLHSHDHSHLDDTELRVRSLETILTQKGFVIPETLDRLIDTYENKIGPQNGASVIAKSWVDPEFRKRLFSDATEAIHALGFTGRQGEHMIALENKPDVHNVVVCTLCSCYPWTVLGLPPIWYKSAPYRSRVVVDPRGVLTEFGLELTDDVEVRVWDSTAETRYLVVPMRPEGSDAMTESQLAKLVNRNSMIGTSLASSPGATK